MWGQPQPYGYYPPAPGAAPAPYAPGPYGAPQAGAAPYPYSPAAPGAAPYGYQPPAAPAPASAYPVIGAVAAAPPSYIPQAPPAYASPAAPAPAPAPQAPVAAGVWGQAPFGQAPPAAAPAAMPVAGSGARRKALIIGCSYPGTTAALKGCINDAQCMAYALKKHFGFTDSDIVLLRDDGQERSADFRSTKANIYRGMQWLMDPAHLVPGTTLVFHFSGHGSQQRSRTGDEADGMDETICPSDYQRAGQMVDNELNRLLVTPLPPGVTLHCIIDACHSGTAMDLCYTTEYDRYRGAFMWTGYAMPHKSTRGGTAIQFGACRDSQVAQDTSSLSGKAFTGAATFAFIQAVETHGAKQTYGQLLSHMTATLHKATKGSNANAAAAYSGGGGGLLGALLGDILMAGPSEPQVPVLSCDKPIDLNTRLMM